MTGPPPQPHHFSPRTQLPQLPRPLRLSHLPLAGVGPRPAEAANHWFRSLMFVRLWGWGTGVIPWNQRTSSLPVWVSLSACRWPRARSLAPALFSLSQQLSLSCPLACLSPFPQSPPSLPAWVAAMGRKRLITDSYPVVKRREGPAGHSKGELAPELGLLRAGGGGSSGHR